MRLGGLTALVLALALAAGTISATAAGDARLAGVQVALSQRGLYTGTIDGVDGPATRTAVVALQRRKGLVPDGIVGPSTLAALGARTDARVLRLGEHGLDVAALQFALASHGFPCGSFDADFGAHTRSALRRFQRWAGLTVDGVAGHATLDALAGPLPLAPVALAYPLTAPIGAPWEPRGSRFHEGIDLIAAAGTPVAAAGPGRVRWAAWQGGGWGNLVVIAHADGVRTLYAHLSRIDVRVGEQVDTGATIGLVGATGDATGPHLHFEVRVRGAAVDPLTALR